MYDTEMIYGITVHIEEGMDKYHDTWREVLTRDIERVIDALPGPALEIVKDTRIYLHKKYIYPGKDDSDGAAVSTSKLFSENFGYLQIPNFYLIFFSEGFFKLCFYRIYLLTERTRQKSNLYLTRVGGQK